jgi:hypothetical protein
MNAWYDSLSGSNGFADPEVGERSLTFVLPSFFPDAHRRGMPKLTSFPEFDSSSSDNLGDDRRVVVMKGALLSELVQELLVRTKYLEWVVKTGLQTVMDDVATGKEPVTSLLAAIPPAAKLLHQEAATLAAELELPYRWVAKDCFMALARALWGSLPDRTSCSHCQRST